MRATRLLVVLVALVALASIAATIVWGDAPMQLAEDVIIWGE